MGALIRCSKKTILLIIIVAGLTLLVSGAISIILDNGNSISLASIGNIHTIGVKAYRDQTLRNQTTGIDWGTVYPGQPYNVTLYLQSVSNVPARAVDNSEPGDAEAKSVRIRFWKKSLGNSC